MAVEYRIHLECNCIFVRATGSVGFEDIVAQYEAYAADPNFRPGLDEFIDFTGVERYNFKVLDIIDAVAFDKRHEDTHQIARSAFVAPQKHVFGLLRGLQILSGDNKTKVGVFRTGAEARNWLGLSAENGPAPPAADVP